jgi:hypothetical protein
METFTKQGNTGSRNTVVTDDLLGSPSHKSTIESLEYLLIWDSRIFKRRDRKQVVILSGMFFGRNGSECCACPVCQVLGPALDLERQ